MEKGVLLIISGPSGVGKGTVVKKLVEEQKNIKLSISATTRKPRPGEEHGREYFFLEKEEFIRLIDENKILEHAQYCENYYGTPAKYVDESLEKGEDVILEIEVQGAQQVKKMRPETVMIFIVPKSMDILKKRLSGRGTEDEKTIKRRLETAVSELKLAYQYDYVVVNDDLDDCIFDILSIIKAEKCKASNMNRFLDDLFI